MKMSIRSTLIAAIVAVSAIALSAENSMAFWGRGSCGSCGGWGRGSGGSWGGSWGSRGSWGGSWGSSGAWGSSGSWGGSYGGYTTYGYGGYARRGYVVSDGYVSTTPTRSTTVAKSAAKTRLTIHVPADAKVTLAGVETKQTGEVRSFSTNRLPAGQIWDDYKVVVETEVNGQPMRQERTIKLTGGQAQDLTMTFADSTQLAQATR